MNIFKSFIFYVKNLSELDGMIKAVYKPDYRSVDIMNISIEDFELKQYKVVLTTWDRV